MGIRVALSHVENGSLHSTNIEEFAQIHSNRQKWFSSLGLRLSDASRVVTSYDRNDYCLYREVSFRNDSGLGMTHVAQEPSDALVTKDKNHILFLPVADCIAATLYDPITETLMLSHLGRHSLVQNGAYKSVKYLVDNYNVDPRNLQIWLSPAPSQEFYPVYELNNMSLKEAAKMQLEAAGIDMDKVIDFSEDTVTDDRYYSHTAFLRGEQPTDGRYAMIAVMN